jgi:hypothetical protein
MEHWYPAAIPSFKIDRARKRGVPAEQRVNLFIREQAAHPGTRIDQLLTRAPGLSFRRKVNGVFEQGGCVSFDGAATSGGLTRKFGLNLRPDVNGDCHDAS